jgi:hypothetical protein
MFGWGIHVVQEVMLYQCHRRDSMTAVVLSCRNGDGAVIVGIHEEMDENERKGRMKLRRKLKFFYAF